MSYFDFEGYFTPSKVEVAITEPNLHIPLIVLLFQNVVWQQVSVMNTSWRIILIYLQNHFLILLYQI